MIKKLTSSLLLIAFVLTLSSAASAHDIFQDVLKEEYMLRSFSCKNCHPDSDDRKIRTAFAERIYQQMKDKGLSDKFAVAVAADEAAKAKDPAFDEDAGAVSKFEEMVGKDFKEAFKVVGQQTMSIDEIIKQGLFNGARLDTKAIEAAAAAKAAAGN